MQLNIQNDIYKRLVLIIIFYISLSVNSFAININPKNQESLYKQMNSAKDLMRNKDYDAANKILVKVQVNTKQSQCDSLFLSELYYLIGTTNLNTGKFDSARSNLNRAVVYINPTFIGRNNCLLLKIYNNLGKLYNMINKVDSSLIYFLLAEKITTICHDRKEITTVYINISSTYGYLEQNNLSLKFSTIAETYIEESDTTNLFNITLIKGNAYFGLMEYSQAERYYLKAIKLARDLNNYEIVYPLLNIITIYVRNKRLNEAEQVIDKLLKLNTNPLDNIYIERAIAEINTERGNWKDAFEANKKSLKIATETFGYSSYESSMSCIYMASSLLEGQQLDSSSTIVNLLNRSIRNLTFETGDNSVDLSQAYLLLGNCYTLTRHPFWAMVYYDSAYRAIQNHEKKDVLTMPSAKYNDIATLSDILYFDILGSVGKVLYGLSNNKSLKYAKNEILFKANDILQIAIQLVSDIKYNISYETSKINLAKNNEQIYKLAARIAFECFQITDDYMYLSNFLNSTELSKSQLLKDYLREDQAKNKINISSKILELEGILNDSLLFYRKKLASCENEEVSNDLKIKEFSVKLRMDSLLKYLEKTYPSYYNIKYSTFKTNIHEMQENISKHTSILNYYIDNNDLYIVHISRKHVNAKKFTNQQVLFKLINDFCSSLTEDPLGKSSNIILYKNQALKIFSLLIKPFEQFLNNELIIIPTESLSFLPFEALITNIEINSDNSFRDLNYLLQKYTISYSYSLEFITTDKFTNTPSNPSVLAIVPSEFNTPNLHQLTSLNYQEKELQKIINSKSTLVLNDETATIANFMKNFQNYSILHFATHTIIDTIPELSGIYFQGMPPDNILHFIDIQSLTWHNQGVVILSSCNTGHGAILPSEGVLALSRAFAYAGAKKIVYNIWNSNDLTSATLVNNLYYKSNTINTWALTAAKRQYILENDEIYSHPHYWAGIVMSQL